MFQLRFRQRPNGIFRLDERHALIRLLHREDPVVRQHLQRPIRISIERLLYRAVRGDEGISVLIEYDEEWKGEDQDVLKTGRPLGIRRPTHPPLIQQARHETRK